MASTKLMTCRAIVNEVPIHSLQRNSNLIIGRLIDVVLSFKPVDEPEKRDKGYFSAKLWKIYVAKNVPATYMRLGI